MIPLTLLGDLAPVDLSEFTLATDLQPVVPGLVLANLEIPFCGSGLPAMPKAGPHLRGNPAHLCILAAAFPSLVVSLANNHIMDFGPQGLKETIAGAHALKIKTVGAGLDRGAASAPLIMLLSGVRVGILAVTDRWFGLATNDRPGVCPLGFDLIGRVLHLRKKVDYLIVSVHGGSEVSPWPAPRWQQTLRALSDCGANLVHAHHPHVPLGYERGAGGWIFYGLGNTLVNPTRWVEPTWTRRSWRVELDLDNPAAAPRLSEWEVMKGGHLQCVERNVAMDSPGMLDLNGPLSEPTLLEGLHQEYAVRIWESFYAQRLNLGDTTGRRLRCGARMLRDSFLALAQPDRWRRLRMDRGLFHHHLFSASTHADEIATALGVLHGEVADRRDRRSRVLAAHWLPPTLFV